MLKSSVVLGAAVVAILLNPKVSVADTYVSPALGISFGGDTEKAKVGFGGNVAFMGRGIGLEIEGTHTPDFYEGVNLTTVSASYIAGGDPTAGGVKPFALVGLTLLRTSIDSLNESENKVALNLAAGIVALFNETVGVRGEIRYLRRIQGDSDLPLVPTVDNFDFWRAGLGVVFRF